LPITAIFLCSYCPGKASETETWQEKQTVERKPKEVQEKIRAIIGLVFLFFYLLKADSKKTKTPTWSDEGAEHRKNSYVKLNVLRLKVINIFNPNFY
jgi:hypothetical protein